MQSRVRAILCGLFLLSGIAGLLYEIAWSRLLALFMGNTAYAQAVVVGVFMAGLATGSVALGRLGDRAVSPVRVYAWLEVAIGLYGLLFPMLWQVLGKTYVSLALDQAEGPKLIGLRLIVSGLAIFIPTFLMGGTLPLLSRFLIEQGIQTRASVAKLYYLNGLGAVVGALGAGFVLIQWQGLTVTLYVAAALNLLVAIVAFSMKLGPVVPENTPPTDSPSFSINPLQHRLVLAALFLSGFAAMAFQVCFFRIVSIGFGSTVYSFTVVIAAFITGLTIGSALLTRLRVQNPLASFAWIQWGVVVAFLLQLPLYRRLPYLAVHVRTMFDLTTSGFYGSEIAKTLTITLSLLVPTALMGMMFPLATQLHVAGNARLGQQIGFVYGFNTVGNLLGAILASLLLIPRLGLEATFTAALACNFLAGALLFSSRPYGRRRDQIVIALASVVAILLLVWNKGWTIPINHTVDSLRIHSDVPGNFEEFSRRVVKYPPTFMKEDANATVVVFESLEDPVLAINGKIQASANGDLATEMLETHIPLLLHPDAQNVLAIGLGSGIGIGSALQHPIQQIDVVELSPAVVEAARKCYAHANHRCLDDPRLRLHLEDGGAFVKRTRRTYDVILNTISHPWVAGVGNLFAVEYFHDCAARLNPDGVMLLWFHLYEMDDDTARLILRTFLREFPHASIWTAQNDLLVVGSLESRTIHLDRVRERLSIEPVEKDLAKLGLDYLPILLSHQLFGEDAARQLAGSGTINSQYHPVLDFRAAEMLFRNAHVTIFGELFGRTYGATNLPPLLAAHARQQRLTRDDFLAIVEHHSSFLKTDDPLLQFYRRRAQSGGQ